MISETALQISFRLSFVLGLIVLMAPLCRADLRVIEPERLSILFHDKQSQGRFNHLGSMKYSVSTFGEIPFDQSINAQLVFAPNDDSHGCEVLEKPSDLKAGKFIWFVRRGKAI